MKWMYAAAIVLPLALTLSGQPESSNVMEQKTRHAQNILRHLAEADLSKVNEDAVSLERATLDAGFANMTDEYRDYGQQFLRVVRELRTESARGNLAGSYYQFSRMTGVCFACHEHLREKAK